MPDSRTSTRRATRSVFGADRRGQWTAERIRSTLRTPDVAARYGGDEFALILPDTDSASATRAAERILESFEATGFEADGRGPVPVSLSIGVASHPADGRTATELIAAADRRLYRVKRVGGHGMEATSGWRGADAGEQAEPGTAA